MVARASLPTRSQFIAVVSGNALEFYDFLSYNFFAVNVARVMFPAGVPGRALLLTLIGGSLGFVARPLGAVVFSLLGDRIGRRPTMLATFGLMGTSSLGMAVTPSYAAIGVLAPVLVVAFRILQGLSAGGDVGPTTAFLLESAPPERRGFYISLQGVAMRLGVVASGVVGLTLAASMGEQALDSYGWRIAFGIGAAIAPLAFVLRRRLDETLHIPETGPDAITTISPRLYGATLLGVLGYLFNGSMGDFMYIYVVTWWKVASVNAYLLVIAIAAMQVTGMFVGGTLSDRVGRRPVKLFAATAILLVGVPVFRAAVASGEITAVAAAAMLIAGVSTVGAGAAYPTFVETTPKRLRCGLVGIGYGLIVALSFGSTAVVTTQYLESTGDLAGPSFGWMLGSGLLLVSALVVPETAPRGRVRAAVA